LLVVKVHASSRSVAEKDVVAEGEGSGGERLCLALCGGAGMQTHRAEIDHEAVLNGRLNMRGKRLTGAKA
jgi:hypothetical protein